MATLITDVSAELLTLVEAKAFARVSHSLEDEILRGLIKEARGIIASKTSQAIGRQTWKTVVAKPDNVTVLYSPLIPLYSVEATLDGEPLDLSSAIIDDATGAVHLIDSISGTKLELEWVVGTESKEMTDRDLFGAWKSIVAFLYDNRGADDQPDLPASVNAVLARNKVYHV